MIAQQLYDLWTIYRCQEEGVRLDLKAALLRPATPLVHATARSLPGFGLWSGRVLSVTVQEQGSRGFVQARWRSGLPAMDLLFIAPSLENRPGAAWVWHHLLQELGRVGGQHKAQRLFAHLPEQRHAEVEVMRQAGFAIYAQDHLFCLQQLPEHLAANVAWEPREGIDDWGLARLYHALTPGVVQQAENMLRDATTDQYAGWWGDSRRGSYVLRGQSEGEIHGFLRLTRGERAHWLKLVLHPEQAAHSAHLLRQGLALLAEWPARPIYCDVREYEGFIHGGLAACGFEPLMARMLLVRHTTASVRSKAPRALPVLEGTPETAATPF